MKCFYDSHYQGKNDKASSKLLKNLHLIIFYIIGLHFILVHNLLKFIFMLKIIAKIFSKIVFYYNYFFYLF